MAQEIDVLDANSAFYRAFAARDVAAMDAVWSCAAPVACVHPGWDALRGREDVMESWRAILAGPSAPDLGCSHAFAQVLGAAALVVCHEHVAGGRLVATNVFVREGDAWTLVHHQASPLASEDEEEPPPGPALN